MERITLKKTKLNVARLGMGTMRLNINNNAMSEEEEAVELLRYAISSGINYIDTAYTYLNGKSELYVGKAIQPFERQRIKIATKCPVWEINTEADFYRILKIQLQRLGTDYIDCYLLHALGKERWKHVNDIGLLDMLEHAKSKGLIKHIGFSFHDTYAVLNEIITGYDSWEMCQLQYNYIDINKQGGTKGVSLAKQKGLDVIIMEPLHGGRLVDPPIQVARQLKNNKSPTEWAFDFLYDKPEVDLVISGMKTVEDIQKNIEYLKNSSINMLSTKEHEMFRNAELYYRKMSLVCCTGCSYCMPCPQGINIPKIMELYNIAGTSHYREAKTEINNIGFTGEECICCKTCESRCPQQIKISQLIPRIKKVFEKPIPPVDLEALRIKWPAKYEREIKNLSSLSNKNNCTMK